MNLTVPKLMKLIESTTARGQEIGLDSDYRTRTWIIKVEGEPVEELRITELREHYRRQIPIPATATVQNGWIAETMTLDELSTRMTEENGSIVAAFTADILAAKERGRNRKDVAGSDPGGI